MRVFVAAVVVLLSAACGSNRSQNLIPAGAEGTVRLIPASHGEPAEQVVTWMRPDSDPAHPHQMAAEIWVSGRRVYSFRSTPKYYDGVFASLGDVTGDGHPDVVVDADTGGSGGCHDYYVVAAVRRRVHEIASPRDVCEKPGSVRAERGNLVVSRPTGPCPERTMSAHCYGGGRTVTLHWMGTHFVPIAVEVVCVRSDLDPRRDCRR